MFYPINVPVPVLEAFFPVFGLTKMHFINPMALNGWTDVSGTISL
jgi:hypothetical protein